MLVPQPIEISKYNSVSKANANAKKESYEILYFESGNGILTKNSTDISFTAGNLFFINKGNLSTIKNKNNITLYIISFTEDVKFILKDLIKTSKGKAVQPLRAKAETNARITINQEDQNILIALFATLTLLQKDFFHNANLMYYHLLSVITIMERNLPLQPNTQEKGLLEPAIQPIIKHIYKNLRTPEMLSLAYIAHTFGMTKNQLGVFFKKELNISVKQYILKTKMEAIAKKIEQQKLSLSEIAYEYGFTDESHFYKSFKKHFNIAPSAFKKDRTAS